MALQLDPSNYNTNNKMGMAKLHAGAFDEAYIYLNKAFNIRPDSVETNYYLGFCLASLGNIEKAKSYFERTLKLQPNHSGARRNLQVISQSN